MASPSHARDGGAGRARPLPGPGLWFLAFLVLGYSLLIPLFAYLGPTWFYAPAGLLVMLGLAWFVRPDLDQVRISRELPAMPVLGRKSRYLLRIENRASHPLRLHVREVLPPSFEGASVDRIRVLPAGEIWTLEMAFVSLERGRVTLPPTGLVISRLHDILAWRVEGPAGTRSLFSRADQQANSRCCSRIFRV